MHRTHNKRAAAKWEKRKNGTKAEKGERTELIRNIDVTDRLLNFSVDGLLYYCIGIGIGCMMCRVCLFGCLYGVSLVAFQTGAIEIVFVMFMTDIHI